MKYPNLNEEKKLWKQGFEWVIGLDEAGRGPLAGPVVAAAVSLVKPIQLKGIRDSKTLSEKQREYFYEELTNHQHVRWAVAAISENEIDKINILNATKFAMYNATNNVLNKMDDRRKSEDTSYLLIDGNFKIKSEILQRSIVKGDSKVFSIAAAGILAKVTRDRMMKELHQQYPEYGFDRHKGYGTRAHLANLAEFGPCKIHRKSFFPVSAMVPVLSKINVSDKMGKIL
jgi:ribonuclease HII